MRRAAICLSLLCLLLTGCADGPESVSFSSSQLHTAAPVASDVIPSQYRVQEGSVTIESKWGEVHPVINFLSAETLQSDGGLLCADGGGLLPGSGGVMYDTSHERVRQMVKEDTPLIHDGSIMVKLNGTGGHAKCRLYDSDYVQVEGNTETDSTPLTAKGIIPLPKTDGIYFVSLSVNWVAAQQFPGALGRESVCYEYVFMVQYKPTASPT